MAEASTPMTKKPTDASRTDQTSPEGGVGADLGPILSAVLDVAQKQGLDEETIDVRLKIASNNAASFADDSSVPNGRAQLRAVRAGSLTGFFNVLTQTAVEQGADPTEVAAVFSAMRDGDGGWREAGGE